MGKAKVGTMPPDVAKAFGKITQIFKDRRLLNGHMFLCPQTGRWHFFYFDQRDTDVRDPHWEHGAHIHFVNWLWPGLTGQGVLETFASAKPKFKGALHLRYLDWRLEDEEGRRTRKTVKKSPQVV